MPPMVGRAHLSHETTREEAEMKGGVILFRGTGAAARRYLESDRSTADEYYLEGGTALAK